MAVSKNDILKLTTIDIESITKSIDTVLKNNADGLSERGYISISSYQLPNGYNSISGVDKIYKKVKDVYESLGWKVELKHNSPDDNYPTSWLEFR